MCTESGIGIALPQDKERIGTEGDMRDITKTEAVGCEQNRIFQVFMLKSFIFILKSSMKSLENIRKRSSSKCFKLY